MSQLQKEGQGHIALSELDTMLRETQQGLDEVNQAHTSLSSRYHVLTSGLSGWQANLRDGRAALDLYESRMADEDVSITRDFLARAERQSRAYSSAVEKAESELSTMATMKTELSNGVDEIKGMTRRLKTRDYLDSPFADPESAPLPTVSVERLNEIRQSIKKAHYFVRGLGEII